jgi:hypothetical protein
MASLLFDLIELLFDCVLFSGVEIENETIRLILYVFEFTTYENKNISMKFKTINQKEQCFN